MRDSALNTCRDWGTRTLDDRLVGPPTSHVKCSIALLPRAMESSCGLWNRKEPSLAVIGGERWLSAVKL
jgi:hypothetical protein